MLRFDTAPLSKVTRTPQGGIRCDAVLTRTGIFEYRNPDGSVRRELRPAEEVFREDSLARFSNVPVTIGHPGLVSSDNWGQHAVGHVGDSVRREEDKIAGSVTVQRADAVRAIEHKTLGDISVGYEVDYDATPGEHGGQRYDGVQRNIRVNHVALIPPGAGRAGPSASLRLDSKGDEICAYTSVTMTPEQIAALQADLKKAQDEISKLRQDVKDSEKLAAKSQDVKDSEKLAAKVEVLTAQVKDLTTQLGDTARFDSAVAERVELEAVAKTVKFASKGKTNKEIKCAVIAAKNPSLRLDGKSDDFVDAAYAMTAALPHPTLGRVREDSIAQVNTGAIDSARERNRKAGEDAWKTPANGVQS
jgi:hypothetical protein